MLNIRRNGFFMRLKKHSLNQALRHIECLSLVLGLICLPLNSSAQTNNDTIKLIVITAAGGAADQAARIVSEKLGPAINKNIVVENKPGAGGNIASKFVASSKPDGYTFLMTSNNHTNLFIKMLVIPRWWICCRLFRLQEDQLLLQSIHKLQFIR